MKIPKKGERLKFFQDLYEKAKSYSVIYEDNLDRHLKQYKGDKAIDGSSEEAGYVRNVTYELIEAQVSSHIPTARVQSERSSNNSEELARRIESHIRSVKDKLPFEEMNDLDERFTYIFGGSIWLCEWDESIVGHDFVGGVRVSIISPEDFVMQPGIYDVEDAEYCFVKFETTREEICRRYNVKYEVTEETDSEESETEETATLIVCFYKNEDDKICKFVYSSDVTLEDIDDYYSRKREYCKRCQKKKQLCECDDPVYEIRDEEYEELERDVITSDGVIPAQSVIIKDGMPVMEEVEVPVTDEAGNQLMELLSNGLKLPKTQKVMIPKTEPTRLPFYTPKRIPIVVRKNTSDRKNVLGQSDCEFLRPTQQAINKIESRILQKLLRAGVTPVMPEDATITVNNSVFGNIIKMRPGESVGQYGVVDTTPDISKDLAEAERLYDQAKRLMGISDSFMGQYDPSAVSGVAKKAQINQAAGRLESKRRMKNAAYANLYRIIFEYSLGYADEPRPAVYVDFFGRPKEVSFNRYDYYAQDESGKWYVNDAFLFSSDASVDVAGSRESLWELNMNNFTSGSYGDPALPETQLIYWLNMEKAHYPHARDNVLRLHEIVQMQKLIQQQQQQLADKEHQNTEQRAELDVLRGREERRINEMRGK